MSKEWTSTLYVFMGTFMTENKSPIQEKLWRIAEEVAASMGYEVEDVELLGRGRRSLLRVTIDKPGGITVDDCAAFSRDFAALMDVEDPVQGAYTLEVSSPGLDRPLKRPRDYKKCEGKLARITLTAPLEGKNLCEGYIGPSDDSGVTLLVEGLPVRIPFGDIKKARLEVEI